MSQRASLEDLCHVIQSSVIVSICKLNVKLHSLESVMGLKIVMRNFRILDFWCTPRAYAVIDGVSFNYGTERASEYWLKFPTTSSAFSFRCYLVCVNELCSTFCSLNAADGNQHSPLYTLHKAESSRLGAYISCEASIFPKHQHRRAHVHSRAKSRTFDHFIAACRSTWVSQDMHITASSFEAMQGRPGYDGSLHSQAYLRLSIMPHWTFIGQTVCTDPRPSSSVVALLSTGGVLLKRWHGDGEPTALHHGEGRRKLLSWQRRAEG
eukprot:1088455-Pleurochrysis_carterae.AAC.2